MILLSYPTGVIVCHSTQRCLDAAPVALCFELGQRCQDYRVLAAQLRGKVQRIRGREAQTPKGLAAGLYPCCRQRPHGLRELRAGVTLAHRAASITSVFFRQRASVAYCFEPLAYSARTAS